MLQSLYLVSLAGVFTVQGVNYLPGDPPALTALMRNLCDVAVRNVVVVYAPPVYYAAPWGSCGYGYSHYTYGRYGWEGHGASGRGHYR